VSSDPSLLGLLERITQAAHYPQIEQPEPVAAAIEGFAFVNQQNSVSHAQAGNSKREIQDKAACRQPWTAACAGMTVTKEDRT
jgi:hypothetical protein